MSKAIPNIPPRGTYDWFPQEFLIRKYIFDTWRRVCKRFGYEEYMTPILENADIYRAKSGEDAGGSELMVIEKEEGDLAIRPEMTPSVTRMVTRIYTQVPKPIRLFSIANFYRSQLPQRGRNREFWQLNVDIFGSNAVLADLEILQLALEMMLAFNAPKDSFVLQMNSRKLIDALLYNVANVDENVRVEVMRILDKWEKVSEDEIEDRLKKLNLDDKQINSLVKFMQSKSSGELIEKIPEIKDCDGYKEVQYVYDNLKELGYEDFVSFQPNVIRGLDYYDGIVFEVFDKDPKNKRAMFGGGRYNGLAGIFGKEPFPAVGAAPGDETLKLFLESWGLLDNIDLSGGEKDLFLPILLKDRLRDYYKLASQLREEGYNVEVGLEEIGIGKALQYADKKKIDFVALLGEDELKNGTYTLKDMHSGEQKSSELKAS